ncbi:MAG: hypothetical protein ACR2N9_09530 [Acidimicrobiia bacterium]
MPKRPEARGNKVPIKTLIIARRPIRLDDFGLSDDIEVVQLVRRLGSVPELAESSGAEVVVIDLSFPEGRALAAIAEMVSSVPTARVLALTPSPPPYADVARAIGAGASGYIDTDAEPEEFAEAVRALHAGRSWLPEDTTQTVLRDVSSDLDVSTQERRSRLLTVALGMVPIAGAIAAIIALLWRKYVAQIGVRPVDLAVDPTTRVVDAVAAMSELLGVFGPLLFVGGWIALIGQYAEEIPGLGWVNTHRRLAGFVLGTLVFAAGLLLVAFVDLALVLFVGPAVAVAILAVVLGLDEELPQFLRLQIARPRHAAAAGIAAFFLFLGVLSTETLVVGPTFGTSGAEGFLVPRVLGFSAQPVVVTEVDGSRPPREVLYLGGNADLYVLVDPCDDDAVEMVSVGSSRINVIDEVTCP